MLQQISARFFHSVSPAFQLFSQRTQHIVLLTGMLSGPELWSKTRFIKDKNIHILHAGIARGNLACQAKSLLARLPAECYIIGHSAGGYMALEVADLLINQDRHRLKGVLVLNSTELSFSRQELRMRQARLKKCQTMTPLSFDRWVDDPSFFAHYSHAPLSDDDQRLLKKMARNVGLNVWLEQMAAILNKGDQRDKYRSIVQNNIPVEILAGKQDKMMICNKPDHHVAIDGCGHYMPVECPDVVDAAIKRMLDADQCSLDRANNPFKFSGQ